MKNASCASGELTLRRSLLPAFVILAIAGCSASTGSQGQALPAQSTHRSAKLPSPDGAYPDTGLTNVGGVLYGTTQGGGTTGNGTVFKITTSGMEQVIYNFLGSPDGQNPLEGRLAKLGPGNLLWGTTGAGGGSGEGIVFTITTSGVETVIHSFSGSDGAEPSGGLIKVGSIIYGTTRFGGIGYGNVFQISANNALSSLYSFQGALDGEAPWAGLTKGGPNVMYGTAYAAGAHSSGVAFKIATSGTYTLLRSFGGTKGQSPAGKLVKVGNAFYGTASQLHGTVYKIAPPGPITVLHHFQGPDGLEPYAGLTYVGGVLYGTTIGGGAHNDGTVFSITPSGTFTVLYNFQGGNDGAVPWGGLTYVQGLLYGTTQHGGPNDNGTVYSITTGGAETVLHSF